MIGTGSVNVSHRLSRSDCRAFTYSSFVTEHQHGWRRGAALGFYLAAGQCFAGDN